MNNETVIIIGLLISSGVWLIVFMCLMYNIIKIKLKNKK